MFLQNSWQKFVNFVSFWYMRYLLVTELYIIEPWERAFMHIIIMIFLAILSYFNVLIARHLPLTLTCISRVLAIVKPGYFKLPQIIRGSFEEIDNINVEI